RGPEDPRGGVRRGRLSGTAAPRVPLGRPWPAQRDTGKVPPAGGLLLDVEQALVHELVDAERAEFAAEAGALGAAERQVRALARRGVDVGHADLELLGDVDRPLLVGRPDRAAEA